jgi:hypothetical protein
MVQFRQTAVSQCTEHIEVNYKSVQEVFSYRYSYKVILYYVKNKQRDPNSDTSQILGTTYSFCMEYGDEQSYDELTLN